MKGPVNRVKNSGDETVFESTKGMGHNIGLASIAPEQFQLVDLRGPVRRPWLESVSAMAQIFKPGSNAMPPG